MALSSRGLFRRITPLLLLSSVAHAHTSICSLARTQHGLLPYFLERAASDPSPSEIRWDFDGDGKNDLLLWSPQDAGSRIPADYASVTLTLSSTGSSVFLEETYVNVLRYQGKYYVTTVSLASEKEPAKTTVYSVARAGFQRLCTVQDRKSKQ